MAEDENGQGPASPQDARLTSLEQRLNRAEQVEAGRAAVPVALGNDPPIACAPALGPADRLAIGLSAGNRGNPSVARNLRIVRRP